VDNGCLREASGSGGASRTGGREPATPANHRSCRTVVVRWRPSQALEREQRTLIDRSTKVKLYFDARK